MFQHDALRQVQILEKGRFVSEISNSIKEGNVTLDRTLGLALGWSKPILFVAVEVGVQHPNHFFRSALEQLLNRRERIVRGFEQRQEGVVRQREKEKFIMAMRDRMKSREMGLT